MNVATKIIPSDETPLARLSSMLDTDMKALNTQIIEHMHSPVPLIPQLASYLIAAGGKRIRPLLTLACTAMYEGNMPRAHKLAAAVEFIHTATLLHDDVVDESLQRRGKDTANLVFGNQASVLVGDFLFSRAFQLMTADGNLNILEILSKASAIIAEGEVMQLAAIGNLDTNMKSYIQVIESKTAALFAAACEVGPVIAGTTPKEVKAMHDYGLNMGIAFQIADDALDYDAQQEELGKTVGDEFREGKITAPVLIALEKASAEEQKFWKRTLHDRNFENNDLKTAQDILKQHQAITKSLALAENYGEKAQRALKNAPEHEIKKQLDALISYAIYRKT